MRPPASTKVQVTRSDTGVKLRVPPPLPAKAAKVIAWGTGVFALGGPAVFLLMPFSLPSPFRWFTAGLMAVLFLASALKLASELMLEWRIEREGDSLTLVKKGLLGTRIRRWPWSRILSVSAAQRGRTQSPSGWMPVLELRIEIEGERPARLLRGYEEYELKWIAWTIRNEPPAPAPESEPRPRPRRIDVPVERREKPPGSRATEEAVAGGFRMVLPALGLFRPQKNGALVGSLVLPVFSVVAIPGMIAFRAQLPGFWPVGVAVSSLFLVVGMLFFLGEANRRSRTGIVLVTRERLRISSVGILGTRSLEWRSEEVRSIRGGFSGTTINDAPQMDLLVSLGDGKEFSWFKGRDRAELEWVASTVWRTFQREPGIAEVQIQSAIGICQICGSEMPSQVVFCARCRTPHHEECWRYTGQCSTYGCREIRFTREADPAR
jgi:hypothetical protein